jgi:diadenylate cyclase
VAKVIERFGTFSQVLRATIAELEAVDGMGPNRARALKEGADRLAESSILNRF